MLVYPFDPQCRLDSNLIKGESLPAFPSAATRTLVPVHAPFFQESCTVKKDGKELVEGVDFFFSIEHKVASYATALRVYGGITLINDMIVPPLTIDYHAQGGAFEADAGQIRQYLDTAPNVWDGSWEALIVNKYYPPVKILYDPEAFVSEPELIEACKLITEAIKAKDVKETISYQMYAMRIQKIKDDLDRLDFDEHILKHGDEHGTVPHDINALAVNDIAQNTKRLKGKDLAAFTAYVNSVVGDLAAAMANKVKLGDTITSDTKFLLDGGTVVLGKSSSLTMDEEGISLIGDNEFKIVADSECKRPGAKASLNGGSNTLVVESTGTAQDDKRLKVNDKEVVTTSTLRAYVNSILAQTGFSFSQQATATMYFTGSGVIASPVEAVPTIPAAAETGLGIVKVVNEGSHGYPCPGYGGTNFYGWYLGGNKYCFLRNGADDLEYDVFINILTTNPYTFTPTADRFRPAGLPATAKPTYIRHGTEDCVWLDTTDGPFILLTGRNPNHHTWRCLKITNAGFDHGYYGCPFLLGGKIYCVKSWMQPSESRLQLFEAMIGTGNSLTFTQRNLTGNNNNGTPQNSTTFTLFDKMIGAPGEKAYLVNGDGYFTNFSISHAGDQFDHVQKGNMVRFNHIGWFWAGNAVGSTEGWYSMSYTLDLTTGVVVPDAPNKYPHVLTKAGMTGQNPRPPLTCTGGNYTCNGVRSNGLVFTLVTYDRLYTPNLYVMDNAGQDSFENAKWDQQYFNRPYTCVFLGLYAGPVHSGIRGVFPLSGNRLVGLCMDDVRVIFQYDPNGSYGPTAKGYGPSNNRVQIFNETLHDSLARMTWYFDGDKTYQAGTYIADGRLTNHSTYDGDVLGTPVSISDSLLKSLKQQAINKYAPQYAASVIEAKISFGIHRARGVKQLGMLQIMHPTPGGAPGQKQFTVYVFEVVPNSTTGNITGIALGKLLETWVHNPTAVAFIPEWARYYFANSGVYRLTDGGHVVVLGGEGVVWVGNGGSPCIAAIYNAAGEYVGRFITSTNTVIGYVFIGTKELGFGITSISSSGEGLYLDSYGKTTAELVATTLGQRQPEKYILVLSRSDAGDNVTMSQLGASKVRDKIQSLIPPARRVQGMDLTQDRTITKAMLANSDKIPNQRDSTYPVQQKHTDTLSVASPKNHQHGAGDFMMSDATLAVYGAGKLGKLASQPTSAASITTLGELEHAVSTMFSRDVVQVKLDNAMMIDYEV